MEQNPAKLLHALLAGIASAAALHMRSQVRSSANTMLALPNAAFCIKRRFDAPGEWKSGPWRHALLLKRQLHL
jgi:hypothetical protein